MLRHSLVRMLLALALLLGQAAAFAHVLGHLHKHDAGLPEPVCAVCVAHANLGSAAPATVFTLPVVPGIYVSLSAEAPAPVAAPPKRAQARAPPASA